MVLVKPTSITHSGTSATLGANGQVTFTAVTSLSLNGVFSADFDNYVMSIRSNDSSGQVNILARLRASGVDADAANYTRQYLFVTSTSAAPARQTSQTYLFVGGSDNEQMSGDHVHIYGPALAQPTATRNVNITGQLGAYIQENACTHSLSTSYDGITLFGGVNSLTGALTVYGVRS